ncbi:MAG: ATP-dependent DNA helicase [Acidobacteria bacterium]|nr:ATP-dependent DNA helicase [Acidobacteriota bacterium]
MPPDGWRLLSEGALENVRQALEGRNPGSPTRGAAAVEKRAHKYACLLGPDGEIARAHPCYEFRPGQVRMAQAVAEAIENRRHLCVEAGTGTGKTLAYLLPSIASRKRVIISTGTKNLQEQLFFKDIPFLEKALGTTLSVSYLKGRSNYLCLRKLADVEGEQYLFSPQDPQYLAQIREWSRSTETGDRAELRDLPEELALWRHLDARRETCTGQKCPDFEACFVTKVRQRAQESDIVIVNHHLFFADLSLRQGDFAAVLPDYSVVIFDEAHDLEDVATQYFGITVSNYRLDEFCRDANKTLTDQGSPSTFLLDQLAQLRVCSADFFSRFRLREGRFPMVELGKGLVVRRGPHREDDLSSLYRALMSHLSTIGAGMASLSLMSDAVEALARRCKELHDELEQIIESESTENVYWYECRGRGVYLWASPIQVGPILKERLFQKLDTAVLTSATLATGGNFRFIRSRVGLEQAEELILGSHFDFSRQAVIFIPRDIPEPREKEWVAQACLYLEKILEASRGRAFVLFTSYSQMELVYAALQGRLPYPMLIQGEKSRTGILEEFRRTPNAVLFATSSFWQGVDVQGEQLSCVVIDKLPFSVPSDPVVAARIRNLNESGGNAFYDYQIPEAIILLKQGLGRLIRSRADRGILALLDKRVLTKSYGHTFMRSLPPAPVTHDWAELQRFFASPSQQAE